MENQDKKLYKWMAKRGSVLLYGNGDTVHLEIDTENTESCLLNEDDTEEIIAILTTLAGDIWNRPGFVREPYSQKLYKADADGSIYWDIDQTRLQLIFNATEHAVELKYSGNAIIELPVNQGVEVIQVMGHFGKGF